MWKPWCSASTSRLRAGGLIVTLVAVMTVVPATAHAQFFGAMPVVDAGAIAQLVRQLTGQGRQIGMQTQQLRAQLDNMRKLSNPNWRSINTTMARIDVLTRQGQAISYSLATLETELQRTFPGWRLSSNMAIDMRVQNERTLATLRGAILAAQATAQQFAVGTARLNAMKGQVGSIRSAQQAAELNGSIGIHTAEEITLLRQQLAAQGNAQAIVLAHQVNRNTQAAAAAAVFDASGARRPPTRPRPRVETLGFVP